MTTELAAAVPAFLEPGFSNEVLVLGAVATEGVPLLGVDDGAQPGQRVG